MRRISSLALVAGIATLGLASSASANAPYTFTSSSGGAAVPANTAWTATGGPLQFFNAATGSPVASCSGSTLSGVTAVGGNGDQLNVQSGSYSGCLAAGSPVFVTVNASVASPWQVVGNVTNPLGGPYAGSVNNVSVTVRCGSPTATPATYSGNLTTGGQAVNDTAGSRVELVKAGTLTKSGAGCLVLPPTTSVTQTNTLTTVGGVAVSPTNNIWVNP